MNKLFSLLKANLSGGIQVFNYRGKTARSRWTMPIVLAVIIGVMMFFSAIAMAAELKEDGAASAILSIYTLVTAVIILTEGIYKTGDLLFRPRDNDMLLAMPIKKSSIVLVRVIKLYVFELLYCLIFLLPAIIAYAINAETGVSYYLTAVTMLLLVPVIPIAISCVMGFVISMVSANLKHKTLLQVVLSFVFLFATAAFALLVNTTSDFDGASMVAISDKINEFYYPASVFARLTTNFDLVQYLIFVTINLAIVAVVVLMIGRFYFEIVTRMNIVRRAKRDSNNYHYAGHGQVFAMVRKELTKYFSTPVLIVNTAIGLVLFMVAIGALCLKFDAVAASLASSVEDFPLTLDELHSYLPSVVFALVAFASLMTYITATLISLEGKAFNLLKSLPISGGRVIMSKVMAALILIVPVTVIGSVVATITFQFNMVDAVLVLVGAVTIPFVAELIGILINLKYARFDAETDAVTVKQSASVIVATFLGLGLVLTVIPFIVAIVFLAGQTTGLLVADVVFIVASLFLCFVAATWGEKRYTELAA